MKLLYNQKLKERSRELRKAYNLAEVLLWQQIKSDKLGYRFLRQRTIGHYIVDFYCMKFKLAVEIDGRSHDAKVTEDRFRQEQIEEKGISFLRFTDEEVRKNLESVVRAIQEHVKLMQGKKSLPLPGTP